MPDKTTMIIDNQSTASMKLVLEMVGAVVRIGRVRSTFASRDSYRKVTLFDLDGYIVHARKNKKSDKFIIYDYPKNTGECSDI